MAKTVYRWRLDNGISIQEVQPRHGSELNESGEKQARFKFLRLQPNFRVKLQRVDFDFAMLAAFNHRYTLYLDRKIYGATVFEDGYRVYTFVRTDCNIDEDNKTMDAKVELDDKYKPIIDNLEKEFNLIDLNAVRSTVELKAQLLFQVYILGSDVITNIVSGNYWEEPLLNQPSLGSAPVPVNDLLTEYFFQFIDTKTIIPGVGGGMSPDVSGVYDTDYVRDDGKYKLITVGYVNSVPQDDPDGEAKDLFTIATPTLDNQDDFYSSWQVGGAQFQFIGGYVLNAINYYFFRQTAGGSPPSAGVLTHLSGATNQGPITYTAHDGNFLAIRHAILDTTASGPILHPYVYTNPWINNFSVNSFPIFPQDAMVSFSSASEARFVQKNIYARILTNSQTVNAVATTLLPDEDLVTKNKKYLRAVPYDHQGFILSDLSVATPTRYGRFNADAAIFAGEYFDRPATPGGGISTPIPVGRSEWKEASLWFYLTAALQSLQETEGQTIIIEDAYKLFDLLNALFLAIDPLTPGIFWIESGSHSNFLFGNNTIRGIFRYMLFIPKSNAKAGSYDQPAQKVPVKLSDVLTFLENFCQVFWYIDSSDRFRLEHVDYFDRGGTYTNTLIGADLTALIEPKTEKLWGYRSKKYQYEKFEMPEQIKHKWMDEVSEAFEGFDIDILDETTEKGRFDEKSLSLFTSDIDFVFASPGNISDDGFVFIEATYNISTQRYEVPFVVVSLADGSEYNMQNGYCAMIYAHTQYWRYHLPADSIKINEAATTALSKRKNKIQKITFPQTDLDDINLITTAIGDGEIRRIERNLLGGRLKLKIAHDTNS